jgi:geranylgeranylglycerol-phosphate geranylgeranyltransferase
MYGVGVLIGIFVADPGFSNFNDIVFGFLTAVFLQASAFALNDYLDYEVDVANKRYDRPLVRGDLSRKTALNLAILLLPPGLVAAFLISPIALVFAIGITVLGYLYDIKLKELGVSGNLYIALTMAAPFLFGSVVATGTIVASSALLSSMAFLSGLGREIMKGIEDVEGDELRNVRSIARVKGERTAAVVAALFFIIAVAISPVPLFYLDHYLMDPKYAVPVAVTDVLLLNVSLKLLTDYRRDAIKKYRKETLVAMMFGLAGFLAGIY